MHIDHHFLLPFAHYGYIYGEEYYQTNIMSDAKSKAKAKDSAINVKLLLIGNSSVGKSSLLLRFSDEQWLPEDEATATIGVDFRVSTLCVILLEDIVHVEHGSRCTS